MDQTEKAGQGKGEREVQIRKYRTLKIAVIWLQDKQRKHQFSRYEYYGCYCLQQGSQEIGVLGYGVPLDPIDKSCSAFKQCYKCLLAEHSGEGKTCTGGELGYKLDLLEEDNVRSLSCGNPIGSCKRNICECDKALAEKLSEHESSWDKELHADKGGFVKDDFCMRKASSGGSSPADPSPEQCCGDKTTFPFNQPTSDTKCCDGPTSKAAGTC